MLPSKQQCRCKRKWPERLCDVCQLPAAGTVGRFLEQILLYDEKFKTGVYKLTPFSWSCVREADLIFPVFYSSIFHRLLESWDSLWTLDSVHLLLQVLHAPWCDLMLLDWISDLLWNTSLRVEKEILFEWFFLNSWTCSIVDRLKLDCLGYKHSWFTLTLAPRLGKASSGM